MITTPITAHPQKTEIKTINSKGIPSPSPQSLFSKILPSQLRSTMHSSFPNNIFPEMVL